MNNALKSFLCTLFLSSLTTAITGPSAPTYGVRLVQAWIPMKDGIRLSATLYMPDGAKPQERFPAILEYLPYRKDDATAARDYPIHSYFAHRGFVSVRVDIRGTGTSEGHTPEREYSEQEQTDGVEVISWLAHQPWSNGSVGMMGISWGGFNAMQMAMRNPPGLKAIIAVDATDELFHDDVHYVDGIMHYQVLRGDIQRYGTSILDKPYYIILNLAVGGNFDGDPASDSILPATMLVDYVRVYTASK